MACCSCQRLLAGLRNFNDSRDYYEPPRLQQVRHAWIAHCRCKHQDLWSHIGTTLAQDPHGICVRPLHSHEERAGTSSTGAVDFGTSVNKRPDDSGMPVLSGQPQRSRLLLGDSVRVRATVHEKLDDRSMPILRRHHDGRGTIFVAADVDVGTGCHQLAHDLQMSIAGGADDSGEALACARVEVECGAGQLRLDRSAIAPERGLDEAIRHG
jgi:hypothetical protein